MNEYAFHPEALQDLDGIWEFICEDNVDAADRTIAEIFSAVKVIAKFPHQGHRRRDLTGRPLRFKPVREYLIVYAPDDQPLLILAILHGRRSPRVLAALLRSRDGE